MAASWDYIGRESRDSVPICIQYSITNKIVAWG